MSKTVKKLTIEQFKSSKMPADIQAVLGRINGGSFMECHQKIYEATGIWIPELVPVFQKLDATLATRDLPRELR